MVNWKMVLCLDLTDFIISTMRLFECSRRTRNLWTLSTLSSGERRRAEEVC